MDWLGDNLWAAWLGAAAMLGVAEMFSLDLVLIMLAVGAVAGMVTAILGAPFALQVLVAAGASVAMLGVVRPALARRFHGGPELRLGHGKLVGHQGVVTEEISDVQHGRIRLAGEIWSAAPYDETIIIAEGETVEVLQIKGATAYVHPVPRLED
jgi:membrane protein implicated in regulation of membrane protease activity